MLQSDGDVILRVLLQHDVDLGSGEVALIYRAKLATTPTLKLGLMINSEYRHMKGTQGHHNLDGCPRELNVTLGRRT